MLAVMMVSLHKLKVHVLENNEGLLDRDFATNEPFFESFGISCGIDLLDEDVPPRVPSVGEDVAAEGRGGGEAES